MNHYDNDIHMLGIRVAMHERDDLFKIARYENRSVNGLVRDMIQRKIRSYKKRLKNEN